jgi:hypothetical protein
MEIATALAIVGIIVIPIGYLLARKDAQQAEFIKDLYEKHQQDAEKLADLNLKLVGQYYDRAAIDTLFINFKAYLNERFDRIEKAIESNKQ